MRAAYLWDAWLTRRMLPRLRDIVAISDFVVDVYGSRTSARFHRIDNPIDPLFFDPPSASSLSRRFLVVANLSPIKNIDVAMRALARVRSEFPDATLEIVGAETDAAYARRLRTLAAPLGDAVRFRGALPPAEVKMALDQAVALVLPSQFEHAPVVVAEAMAAGRPVIASAVGGIPGLVTSDQTGCLIPPGDVEALAAAMSAYLPTSSGRERWGRGPETSLSPASTRTWSPTPTCASSRRQQAQMQYRLPHGLFALRSIKRTDRFMVESCCPSTTEVTYDPNHRSCN